MSLRRVLGLLFLVAGAIAMVLTAFAVVGLLVVVAHYPGEPEDTWAMLIVTAITLGATALCLLAARWLRRGASSRATHPS